MDTDGFMATINCSPGHTQGREKFPQWGGWGLLPAAQASHLTVTFNTTLPEANRVASVVPLLVHWVTQQICTRRQTPRDF